MSPARAYGIASIWGSYMRSGDPGSCFYGFYAGDGRPVSEEHRAACLSYLDEDLLPTVKGLRAAQNNRAGKEGWTAEIIDLVEETVGDLKALSELRAYLAHAPLRPDTIH